MSSKLSASANTEARQATSRKAAGKPAAKAEAAEATTTEATPKVNRSQAAHLQAGIAYRGRGANGFYKVLYNKQAIGQVTRVEGDLWTFEGAPSDFKPVARAQAAEALVLSASE